MADDSTIFHPGDSISNDNGKDDAGALGCFARASDGSTVVLSCAHVEFAEKTKSRKVAIYSPPPSSTCCRHQIGTTLNSWDDGFDGPVKTIATDGTTFTGFLTDCAVAKLLPTVLYSNEVKGGIGMITGTPASGIGVSPPPPFGTPPTPDQIVRFYSPVTGRVHYGTLLPPDYPGRIDGGPNLDPLQWPEAASDKSDTASDTKPLVGPLIVMPRLAPGEKIDAYLDGTRRLIFGQFGDSGSVVLNHQNQVIGVICRGADPMSEKPFKPPKSAGNGHAEWEIVWGIGTLSPIASVLKKLQITIPGNLAKTTPSAGDLVLIALPTDPDEVAVQRGQARIGAQLRASRLGRIILEKLARHRKEARQILERNRQARLAWRACQGPAFVAHCTRNLRDSRHRVPIAINGVTRTELVNVMAEVLTRYGSPALQRDVARYRDLALRHAPVLTRLDDVAPAIAELQRERTQSRRAAGVAP